MLSEPPRAQSLHLSPAGAGFPAYSAWRVAISASIRMPPRSAAIISSCAAVCQCGFCPDQPLIDLVSRRDGEVRLAMNDIGQDRHLRSPLIQIKLASWLRGQGQRGVGAD